MLVHNTRSKNKQILCIYESMKDWIANFLEKVVIFVCFIVVVSGIIAANVIKCKQFMSSDSFGHYRFMKSSAFLLRALLSVWCLLKGKSLRPCVSDIIIQMQNLVMV